MELEKYRNDGWGISVLGFTRLHEILQTRKEWQVLEFGSGTSTQFFDDYHQEYGGIQLDSFDNDEAWAHKLSVVRPLVETDDFTYEKMFRHKAVMPEAFELRDKPPHTRQKNCFYQFKPYDLRDSYDLMVVDGPHGNGRNYAYLYAYQETQTTPHRLDTGAYVFIDDFNHYDFVERMGMLYAFKEVHPPKVSKMDNHIILQITGVKA